MFEEYDTVRASKNLSSEVHIGCVGVVVFIHTNPKIAYEVEFFDDEGDTIDVLTVEPSDIEVNKT